MRAEKIGKAIGQALAQTAFVFFVFKWSGNVWAALAAVTALDQLTASYKGSTHD